MCVYSILALLKIVCFLRESGGALNRPCIPWMGLQQIFAFEIVLFSEAHKANLSPRLNPTSFPSTRRARSLSLSLILKMLAVAFPQSTCTHLNFNLQNESLASVSYQLPKRLLPQRYQFPILLFSSEFTTTCFFQLANE